MPRFSKPQLLSSFGTGLAVVTAAAHIFLGTFDTLKPAMAADLSVPVEGTIAACWHFISLFLAVSAFAFLRRSPAAPLFAWLWIGFGAIFIATAVATGGLPALLALPQWVLLIPAGAFVLSGTRPVSEIPRA